MARLAVRAFYVLTFLTVIAGGIALWGYAQYARPGPLKVPATIIIPKGAGVDGIANILADEGVIADPRVFRLGARITGAGKTLRAGEYIFPALISPREVIRYLQIGSTVVRRLTVAEGLPVSKVIAQLKATDGLIGDSGPMPREGSLLPETYYFSYGDERKAVIARMAGAMEETVQELWKLRAKDLPLKTPLEVIILASVVEKETSLPEERGRIAAVFLNRLKKGMRLQSDPTVAYGLTGGMGNFDRPLTRADLRIPTPYNTYLINGLPPGPISNPGRASLAAVLQPTFTDELYFVADGTGGHVFSRTLAEHNRNVAKWRQIQKSFKASPQ